MGDLPLSRLQLSASSMAMTCMVADRSAILEGRIEHISFGTSGAGATIQLPADVILAPGLIDVQVNGGGGVLLNHQPTAAGVQSIVATHRKSGTTGCLPTLITDRSEVMERLAGVAPVCLKIPGVLGFHLEGPALNRSRKGIHLDREIRLPDDRDLAAIRSFGAYGRSLVTVAPECIPEHMIKELVGAGLRVAAGHSEATATEIEQRSISAFPA